MITPTREKPKVTDLQKRFLKVLSNGKLKGTQMRERLRKREAERSDVAFFRVMQRLKRRELITAEPAPRPKRNYRGPECFYELTASGRHALGLEPEFGEGVVEELSEEECRRQIEGARLCVQ